MSQTVSEATKQEVVSAQSLTESLTTFGDLYREAHPEGRRELIRLRVNQLMMDTNPRASPPDAGEFLL